VSGSPDPDAPNPCLTPQALSLPGRFPWIQEEPPQSSQHLGPFPAHLGWSKWVFLPTCYPRRVWFSPSALHTLYSTLQIHFIAPAGFSTTAKAGPLAPGDGAAWRPRHLKPGAVTFWAAIPPSSGETSFSPREQLDDYCNHAACQGKLDSESCRLPFLWTINIPLKS